MTPLQFEMVAASHPEKCGGLIDGFQAVSNANDATNADNIVAFLSCIVGVVSSMPESMRLTVKQETAAMLRNMLGLPRE